MCVYIGIYVFSKGGPQTAGVSQRPFKGSTSQSHFHNNTKTVVAESHHIDICTDNEKQQSQNCWPLSVNQDNGAKPHSLAIVILQPLTHTQKFLNASFT